MTLAEAKAFRERVERAAKSVADDEEALELMDLFPAYQVGKTYEPDDRFRLGGKLYRVVQGHTSQEDWYPPSLPSLYAEVKIEEYPPWVQPTGAQDAYPPGSKVSHDGKKWMSEVDANVWEPGVYGWVEAD